MSLNAHTTPEPDTSIQNPIPNPETPPALPDPQPPTVEDPPGSGEQPSPVREPGREKPALH